MGGYSMIVMSATAMDAHSLRLGIKNRVTNSEIMWAILKDLGHCEKDRTNTRFNWLCDSGSKVLRAA
jgi:hypothetical protein